LQVHGDHQPDAGFRGIHFAAQDDPRYAVPQATPAMLSPQTSVKLVGGYGASVDHVPAMVFDAPSMDDGLRMTLAAHKIVLGEKWTDVE